MAWIALIIASGLEVVWAMSMKQSDGFTRVGPTALMVVTMIGSFIMLAISMKTLPLSTAYPMWTGLGAVGAVIVGIMVLGEAVTPLRIVAMVLIASGLVLLKVGTSQ